SGLGNPADFPACGLWQSVQSPCAPGCWNFDFSILSAWSEWQPTHSSFTLACVRTTFPFFAGWWQTSQSFSPNGGCTKACISFGRDDWCGSWQVTQSAFPNGCPSCALINPASLAS